MKKGIKSPDFSKCHVAMRVLHSGAPQEPSGWCTPTLCCRISPVHAAPSMHFSGAVKVHNLSDYIAPSTACVISQQAGPIKLQAGDIEVSVSACGAVHALCRRSRCHLTDAQDAGAVQLNARAHTRRDETPGGAASTSVAPVKVSLHDCLACR